MENQEIKPPKMNVSHMKTLIKDRINAEYREYVAKRKELGIAGPYTKECNGVRAMTQNQFVWEVYMRISEDIISQVCDNIFTEAVVVGNATRTEDETAAVVTEGVLVLRVLPDLKITVSKRC